MKTTYIWMLIIILLLNIAKADLTTDLQDYWAFNQSLASYGINADGLTAAGDADWELITPELNGYTGHCDGTGDNFYQAVNYFDPWYDKDFTICFWSATNDTADDSFYFSAEGYIYVRTENADADIVGETSGVGDLVDTGTDPSGSWDHICLWRDADTTNTTLYVNNVNKASKIQAAGTGNAAFRICSQHTGAAGLLTGYIDEFGIWNRSLDPTTEITALYNSGTGFFYPFINPPPVQGTLTLNTNLVNTINYNDLFINITYNGTESDTSQNIYNCSLYNGTDVLNTSNNVNVTILNYITIDTTNVEQNYNLSVNCVSGVGINDTTANYSYKVDTINPRINTPFINGTNYTIGQTSTFTVNFTDYNLYAYNITLYDNNNNVIQNKFNDTVSPTFIEITESFVTTTELNYTWRAEVWDSHTARKSRPLNIKLQDSIEIDSNIVFTGEIDYDLTEFILNDDRYKIEITFLQDSLYHNFNISSKTNELIYIPNSKWLGHFVWLQGGRWLDLESDNIKNLQVNRIGDIYNIQIELYQSEKEIIFNSIGDLNYQVSEWKFQVIDSSTLNTLYLSQIATNTGYLQDIYRVIKLIPMVMIYIALMAIGYWMITSYNTISGWLLYIASLGFDFLFIGYSYTEYINPITTASIANALTWVFGFFCIVWILAKFITVLTLQQKVKY